MLRCRIVHQRVDRSCRLVGDHTIPFMEQLYSCRSHFPGLDASTMHSQDPAN